MSWVPDEPHLLVPKVNAEEQAAGMALLCMSRPTADLEVRYELHGM